LAKEQDRPDVARRRARWLWLQRRIGPTLVRRMVFIDGSEAEAAGDKPGRRPT
jgi:hypothetical protein